MSLLGIENLEVDYGAIKALRGISLSVATGKIVALIGCNGAGKSTTLRAISGLVPIAKGQISFNGKILNGQRTHEIVRQGIAHAPEGRGIFANLSVQENLDMGGYTVSNPQHLKDDFEKVLQYFPRLRERLQQSAGTLSGGEQQMLAIARALLLRPKLLLLDEPSLGLAPQIVQSIFGILRDINQEDKTTILLVEQNARLALRTAHQGYVLEVGKIALQDSAENLLKSDAVKKAYLGG